jgi:hypothetical protein
MDMHTVASAFVAIAREEARAMRADPTRETEEIVEFLDGILERLQMEFGFTDPRLLNDESVKKIVDGMVSGGSNDSQSK